MGDQYRQAMRIFTREVDDVCIATTPSSAVVAARMPAHAAVESAVGHRVRVSGSVAHQLLAKGPGTRDADLVDF